MTKSTASYYNLNRAIHKLYACAGDIRHNGHFVELFNHEEFYNDRQNGMIGEIDNIHDTIDEIMNDA
jgi:hypothetical protein